LDKLLFPCGTVFVHMRLNNRFNIQPMVVHVNFMVGARAKKNALIESDMWYI
jgi:hypothetical protein